MMMIDDRLVLHRMMSTECAAHQLNLCVKAAIKAEGEDLAVLLNKARGIVGHFKHSNASLSELRQIQDILDIPQATLLQVLIYLT